MRACVRIFVVPWEPITISFVFNFFVVPRLVAVYTDCVNSICGPFSVKLTRLLVCCSSNTVKSHQVSTLRVGQSVLCNLIALGVIIASVFMPAMTNR